jgi:hypothetical protein
LQHTNEICKWPKGDLPFLKVNVERLIIFSSNQQRLGFGSHPSALKPDIDLEKKRTSLKRGEKIQELNLVLLPAKSFFRIQIFPQA